MGMDGQDGGIRMSPVLSEVMLQTAAFRHLFHGLRRSRSAKTREHRRGPAIAGIRTARITDPWHVPLVSAGKRDYIRVLRAGATARAPSEGRSHPQARAGESSVGTARCVSVRCQCYVTSVRTRKSNGGTGISK